MRTSSNRRARASSAVRAAADGGVGALPPLPPCLHCGGRRREFALRSGVLYGRCPDCHDESAMPLTRAASGASHREP